MDTTERLHFHFSLSCIGEGNSNPLQYSCLENPRDRGAWWAAVYGVAQSRTRLKRLSRAYVMKGSLQGSRGRGQGGREEEKELTTGSRRTPSGAMEVGELLLLLSRFSCVRLCATPQMAAHKAPPSLEFSRQEHWSGLPFPSPMHESEK